MGSCSSSRPRDPVHPRATGSTDWGPVHLVATPRGPFHPTPTGNCTSQPHNNAHCSSRGSIDRLQLAAVAKESLDRSGSITRSLQCNRSGLVRRMPRSGSVRAQHLTPTRVRFQEKRASLGPRPLTITGNSPIFSSPSLLPWFFPSLLGKSLYTESY